jgi:hypothetical protein
MMKKEKELRLRQFGVILIKNLVSEGNNNEMDSTNNNKYIQ